MDQQKGYNFYLQFSFGDWYDSKAIFVEKAKLKVHLQ